MGLLLRRRDMMLFPETGEFWETAAPYYQIQSNLNTSGKAVQGACFYTLAGTSGYDYCRIYFVTINNDSSEQYLYTYDIAMGTATSWGFTLRATYTTLGHANSMTCDQANAIIYVATLDATLGIKKISATSYDELGSFQVLNENGTPYIPWGIALNRNTGLLYSRYSSTVVYVHDTEGHYVDKITLSSPTTAQTGQGMETDGKYLYLAGSSPNCVDVYTLSGKYIKTITLGMSAEFEELVYDWRGGFYACNFIGNGAQGLYGVLLRSFNNKLRLSIIPPCNWTYNQQNGTVARGDYYSLLFKSTGTKNYNLVARSNGYPYGMSFLRGKRCTFKCKIERVAGSSGQIGFNFFTADTQNVTTGSQRKYINSVYYNIPSSGTLDVEYSFIPGTSWFLPTAANEGTYVGFWIFMYADNGNQAWVRDFQFSVEV